MHHCVFTTLFFTSQFVTILKFYKCILSLCLS